MKKLLVALMLMAVVIAVLLMLGKKSVSTEIVINAPINRVWIELTDFAKYPDWNPFIKRINGAFEKGKIIEVVIQPEGSEPFVFAPEVKLYEENSILQWEGKFLIPGIFTGRHTFELVGIGAGKTKLIQKEDFNGILVPFFNFKSTISGFDSMNRKLKRRVEKQL